MKEEKYILISANDPRAKSLGDVFGNKTCNKIIDYLSTNSSASQKDLSDALNMPINTVEYNIKKLLLSGLIKKHKNFFWSVKGKKIIMYELSRKSIIIFPRGSDFSEKLKSILPSFMIATSVTVLAFAYEKIMNTKNVLVNYDLNPVVLEKSINFAQESIKENIQSSNYINTASNTLGSLNHNWLWFFAGAIVAITVFSIINWKKL